MDKKEIKSYLTLDDLDFKSKLSSAEKSVLKFSASTAALGAAASAIAITTAKWQDETGKLAQKAGVSAESFSKLSVAAAKSNVSQEDLAVTLGKISSASGDSQKKLLSVGIALTKTSGEAKTSTEIFGEIADKVAGAGTTAAKTAIAVRALGEEGAKLVPILAGGTKGFTAAGKEAEKYGLIVTTAAAAAAAKFNEDLDETQNALKGLVSSLGESLIAWSNQGGIMSSVRTAIAGVTQWWRNLDDTTKNFIITVGAVVVGIGAIATALIALKAIAPLVGTALSTMFGPVGLIVQAVALGIGAVISASDDYAGTLDNFAIPATEQMTRAGEAMDGIFKKFPQTTEEANAAFTSTAAAAAKVEKPISIIGTVVAWITKQFNLAKAGWAFAFELVAIQIDVTIQRFKEAYEAVKQFASGNVQAAQQALARYQQIDNSAAASRLAATEAYIKNRAKIEEQDVTRYVNNNAKKVASDKKTMEQLLAESKQSATFSSPIIAAYRDIGLSQKKLAGITDQEAEAYTKSTDKMQRGTVGFTATSAIGYAKLAEAVVNSIGPMINAASMVTGVMAKATQYAATVATRDLDVLSIRAQKAYDENKAALEAAAEAETQKITDEYDARISAVTNGEAAITAAIEAERNKRLLADDAEYQAAVEALRLQFEAKLALIDQNSLDIEQRRLNDAAAQTSFDAQLAALAADFAGKKDKTNKDIDAKAAAQQKLAADQTKKLEADKNAALAAAKIAQDAKMKALDEKKAADDKALEKQKLQVQYDAQVQEFNQTRAVKSVEIVASGIAAAAQAFAATAGSLPFGLGIPIGLAVAGVILGATSASVAQLNSQVPVKPAALVARDGGTLVAGETHYGPNGGIDVKAQRGETILSDHLTNKLDSFVDGGSGPGQNIYFQDGAFRLLQIDRELIRELAVAVGDEIRSGGGLALA